MLEFKSKYDEILRHYELQKQQLDDARSKVVELSLQLKDEKESALLLSSKAQAVRMQQKSNDEQEEELYHLRLEKQQLEQKLINLSKSPFYEDFSDQIEAKTSLKSTREELAREVQKYSNMKQGKERADSELAKASKDLQETNGRLTQKMEECAVLKQEQSLKISKEKFGLLAGDSMDEYNQFLQTLKQVKWEGKEPVWKHMEVIDRQYKGDKSLTDVTLLQKEVQNLIQEKGELASFLEKASTLQRSSL